MTWQTIDTAPKDGSVVWCFQDGCQFAAVHRPPAFTVKFYPQVKPGRDGDWWVQGYGLVARQPDGFPMIVCPTHWQPLSPPPEVA